MKKALVCLLLLSGRLFAGAPSPAAPDGEGFIRDWLVAGPYPSYVVDGRDTGLRDDPVDEAALRPYPELRGRAVFKADTAKLIAGEGAVNEWGFRADYPVDIVWTPRRAPEYRLMVDGFFPPIEDHFFFYAACYLESPDERRVKFRLGSDDHHRLRVNGVVLGEAATSQAVRKDGFVYTGTLRRGLNLVLVKVVDVINHCGFALAVSDLEDRPLRDLKIHLDPPTRAFDADYYDNGYALRARTAPGTLFSGEKQALGITLFAPGDGAYVLRHPGGETPVVSGKTRNVPLELAEGEHRLDCRLARDGREVAAFAVEVRVHSRRRLEQRREALAREVKGLRGELAGVTAEGRRRLAARDAAQADLEAARDEIERRFAAERAAAVAAAKPSVDLPLPAFASSRSRLCINGTWRMGAKPDAMDGTTHLPGVLCGNYFRSRYYPVRLDDPAKPHSSPVTTEPGHEYFQWNPLLAASRVFFTRDVDPGAVDPEASLGFVSTHIAGRIRLYHNDKPVGDYDGMFGVAEIPLERLEPGPNRFTLEFRPSKYNHKMLRKRGPRGDLYLDAKPKRRVDDVWVRTSHRKATLSTTSELVNAGDAPFRYELRQYAVEGDRIRFALPVLSGEVPPGARRTVENAGAWADPVLWSLENPHLYTLVSDLYVDGRQVDRKIDRFGFREMWLHGVDFFFNGRRILLQGDVGHADWSVDKHCEVAWPLYRADGVNILRLHDSTAQNAANVPELADRLGMFVYAQYYPVVDHTEGKGNPPAEYRSVADFLASGDHRWNMENLRRFHRMMRNHPSVVVWSTDNEIYTQSRDTAPRKALNARNDAIAAEYARALERLDPGLIVTRDGDIGTWNSKQNYFEDPPRPTANYHYPDFDVERWVDNWQTTFEFRPVIFGETLYCSYGAWNRWSGATPEAVANKARRVRAIAGLYRRLGVPVQVYMGPGLDGFVELKPDGSGIPWGVVETPRNVPRPEGWRRGVPESDYPWQRIDWPAYSGRGARMPAHDAYCGNYGHKAINWCQPRYPSHVRNAVNDAYRDTLVPQPPLQPAGDAECLVRTAPEAAVWTTLPDGRRYGVVADREGRAWMQLPAPGVYRFRAGTKEIERTVPGRSDYAAQPGFDRIAAFAMDESL